jgi:hypothetical protein
MDRTGKPRCPTAGAVAEVKGQIAAHVRHAVNFSSHSACATMFAARDSLFATVGSFVSSDSSGAFSLSLSSVFAGSGDPLGAAVVDAGASELAGPADDSSGFVSGVFTSSTFGCASGAAFSAIPQSGRAT